jgi:hypothetical protein
MAQGRIHRRGDSPEKGIFAGQAALINLEDQPGRDAVVVTPAAQRLNFDGSARAQLFPGSLMGVLAYIKQTSSMSITTQR